MGTPLVEQDSTRLHIAKMVHSDILPFFKERISLSDKRVVEHIQAHEQGSHTDIIRSIYIYYSLSSDSVTEILRCNKDTRSAYANRTFSPGRPSDNSTTACNMVSAFTPSNK